MDSTRREVLHEGNTVVSVEVVPDHPDPVVWKRPSGHHPSRQVVRSLENEYEMTRTLEAVEGVRDVIGQNVEQGQSVLLELVMGPLPAVPKLSGQWRTL